jgi:DNA-binding CsgD family transcriptional regulator
MKRESGECNNVGGITLAAATAATDVAYKTRRRSPSYIRGNAGALPLSVLTTALCLSLWVAFGSFVLAAAEGLRVDPVRRLIVGVVLVLGTALALSWRRRVCVWLFVRPWLVLVVAVVQLAVVAVDGLVGGPYVAFTLTSIGIAVVVAPTRMVWWCVVLLVVCFAAGVLIGHSPERLVQEGQLAGVLGQALAYPFAALGLLGLATLFKRFVSNAPVILESIRAGAPALTPALGYAIANPGKMRALPPGEAAPIRLTAAEIRVVEGLAQGKTAKQLAYEWGVSLATVRTHIKHAKRKTHARTLRQLAGLVARPDWPEVGSADGD